MLTSIIKPGYQITARVVPEPLRLYEMPKRFPNIYLVVEQMVFQYLEKFVPGHHKTHPHWDFVNLSNGGFYMRLRDSNPISLMIPDNYFSETLSADAVSIIVNLYAYAKLSAELEADFLPRHFELLRDFAKSHVEGNKILESLN